MQQTICRKSTEFIMLLILQLLKLGKKSIHIMNLILESTNNISNTMYSVIVKIFTVVDNPQITKAHPYVMDTFFKYIRFANVYYYEK
jgi:hypothetical protein